MANDDVLTASQADKWGIMVKVGSARDLSGDGEDGRWRWWQAMAISVAWRRNRIGRMIDGEVALVG